jgi:hypothetical protein
MASCGFAVLLQNRSAEYPGHKAGQRELSLTAPPTSETRAPEWINRWGSETKDGLGSLRMDIKKRWRGCCRQRAWQSTWLRGQLGSEQPFPSLCMRNGAYRSWRKATGSKRWPRVLEYASMQRRFNRQLIWCNALGWFPLFKVGGRRRQDAACSYCGFCLGLLILPHAVEGWLRGEFNSTHEAADEQRSSQRQRQSSRWKSSKQGGRHGGQHRPTSQRHGERSGGQCAEKNGRRQRSDGRRAQKNVMCRGFNAFSGGEVPHQGDGG